MIELDQYLKHAAVVGKTDLRNKRVLDLGCGYVDTVSMPLNKEQSP